MKKLIALAVLTLLGAGACGSSKNKATPATTTTTAAAAATATSTTSAPTTSGPAASTSATPVAGVGLNVTQLAAGDQHACAVTAEGATVCWGYHRMGQLGDGTNADHSAPAKVSTTEQFKSVVSGRYFSCGLTADGRALCWGDNAFGQLGNGKAGPVPTATCP